MRRPSIEVVLTETRMCAYVRGHGARELLTSLRGRPPVYATKHRAWVTTETTARDLVALAELRDYEVTVLGGGRS
jgi:hypothetical protein